MTYVLLPGAGGDSWYWHPVADRLRARGHEVLAPDLPYDDESAGIVAHADIAVAAIGGRSDVIVATQSMGAFAAPLICDRVDVARLALVVPMIPAPGEAAGAWWEATGQAAARRENELRAGRDPDKPFDVVEGFFHDVPADLVEAAMARPNGGQADKPFDEPWPLDAWPDVPTRVLVGARDRLFPLEFARRVARERLGVEADVIDSGHLPALSRPDELTAWLDD